MPRFAEHPKRRPAIVTGASSGIGAATALALAAAGHPVALGARRVERLEELVSTIDGEAVALRLDLADSASIKDFVAGAEEALGPIEVLVSNAGETALGRGITTPAAEFAEQVQVNLSGPQELVARIAPGMVERGRGDLVFVTTDALTQPRPGMAAYQAAKWGLEGLARVTSMELEGTGVRTSIVRPGPTATEMGTKWDADTLASMLGEWTKWGLARHDAFLRPEHVASAIAHVVSMPRGASVSLIELQPEAPGPHDLPGGAGVSPA
jgi:NADP-dependent 3-hydroxy acid dehydrogenase YdfG